MQHLDEGTIHAWLDGELPPAEREAAEMHVAQCEQCAVAVAEARGFIAASSRILLALDGVPGGVIPASEPSPGIEAPRAASRFALPRVVRPRAWMAAAAVLVLGTATAIAIRPRKNEPVASATVAAATAPKAGAAPTLAAPAATMPPANAPSSVPSRAPANALADAKASRDAPLRKDRQSAEEADKQPMIVAEAAPSARTAESASPAPAPASPSPRAGASGRTRRESVADSSAVTALAAQAPSAELDSTRARKSLGSNQVIITGEGVATSSEKLGAVNASNEAPLMISRNSAVAGTDTTVTTVYVVNRRSVTLVDRPSARDEVHRAGAPGFSDQLMAKARDTTAVNSITWSDSAGRTRTLRGAMSQAELQRVRVALFGPTP